jgi:hypothetical protein
MTIAIRYPTNELQAAYFQAQLDACGIKDKNQDGKLTEAEVDPWCVVNGYRQLQYVLGKNGTLDAENINHLHLRSVPGESFVGMLERINPDVATGKVVKAADLVNETAAAVEALSTDNYVTRAQALTALDRAIAPWREALKPASYIVASEASRATLRDAAVRLNASLQNLNRAGCTAADLAEVLWNPAEVQTLGQKSGVANFQDLELTATYPDFITPVADAVRAALATAMKVLAPRA